MSVMISGECVEVGIQKIEMVIEKPTNERPVNGWWLKFNHNNTILVESRVLIEIGTKYYDNIFLEQASSFFFSIFFSNLYNYHQ